MSSTSPTGQQGTWPSLMPYAIPPLAASAAIVIPFRGLIDKSAQQLGNPLPKTPIVQGLKEGLKAAPTVGAIVGSQMVLQNIFQKTFAEEGKKANLPSTLASSAAVGLISAPALAVFNGQAMGENPLNSLKKLSIKQGGAITVQETAFVAGLGAADRVSDAMKEKFGDNKAVEYAASFTSGAMGSLAGHPANTALTRWQKGLTVNSVSQSMKGATRKAAAIGLFSTGYKLGKETLNSLTEN